MPDATQPANARVDRPFVPDGYGLKGAEEGFLSWEWVTRRLAESRNYWVGSTRPDGRPHVSPVWGVWHEGAVYFSTGATTRKSRNLAHRPEAVIHLESGDDVVILEGAVHEPRDSELLESVATAYEEKYDLRPPLDPATGSLLYALRPVKVLAWREQDFPSSATRWRFGS